MNKITAIKIAKQYAKHIKKTGIPVEKVYIFGSYVTGKAHSGSDIDICVVSSIFGKDRLKERVMLMKLQEEVSDYIEPHPFSPKDFSNPFDPLASQIKEQGLLIS